MGDQIWISNEELIKLKRAIMDIRNVLCARKIRLGIRERLLREVRVPVRM